MASNTLARTSDSHKKDPGLPMRDGYKKILSAYTRNQENLLPLLIAVQNEQRFLSPESIRQIGRYVGLTDNEVYGFASAFPKLRFSPADASQAQECESSISLCSGFSGHPKNLDEYLADGGFKGFPKALRLTPEDLEEEICRSGLEEGDDATHFLVQRWQQYRQSAGEKKLLIVHAAAAEPFVQDARYLMEGKLFSVLEGMLITAFAAGASHGIVCIDGRYTGHLPSLEVACRQMKDAGYVGADILGSGFNFDLSCQVVEGPLCWGNDSRLISALEGRRIMECGHTAAIHDFPAVIHTPEMLRQLPAIIDNGADWYAGLGVNGHKGTQFIALKGKVRKPGCYDIPMGTAISEIVQSFGGGVPQGEMLKAVQIGGPTGGWIAADALDIPLDRRSVKEAGASLGPGIMTVATQDACALELARQALVYARDQSCGDCLFCREGSRQMAAIITDITKGKCRPDDLDVMAELAEGLKLNSACCLGRTAPDAYLSTLRYFRKEYDAHLKSRCCPAGVCGIG